MANIKSAKKRIKVINTKTERNKAIKTKVKTYIKKVEAAIAAQFQLLAQQKQFKVPEIYFSDYHWDTSRKLKRIQRL